MGKELEKINDVREKSQAIGEFLEWLFSSKNYCIARYLTDEEEESAEWGEDALIAVLTSVEELLAEFFKINLVEAEKEQRQLLEQIGER